MVQVKDLTELTLRDLWQEVKDEDDWWGELKGQTMRLVKRFLESAMEEEIRVPRDREGSYRPGVLPRHRRRQHQVDRTVRQDVPLWDKHTGSSRSGDAAPRGRVECPDSLTHHPQSGS